MTHQHQHPLCVLPLAHVLTTMNLWTLRQIFRELEGIYTISWPAIALTPLRNIAFVKRHPHRETTPSSVPRTHSTEPTIRSAQPWVAAVPHPVARWAMTQGRLQHGSPFMPFQRTRKCWRSGSDPFPAKTRYQENIQQFAVSILKTLTSFKKAKTPMTAAQHSVRGPLKSGDWRKMLYLQSSPTAHHISQLPHRNLGQLLPAGD